ncbi:MAG: hypothetical protein A2Y28_05010 [Chlamydiae bacterium GWC2_50_10]|nr:MAG: hypothetical protein A2Z85_02185 [Chlamydiae bacterium GWA2_50_15]OGN54247.1 MAG: hypothetical protein A2098_03365 [Chlamydiae bacterium GWF2_49_8]OGN54319.1 MAG: hypothetical protein A2Y28_05010 [Chlamydiae bacterium GWC2_50_10]OGN58053.1 MAG: hypothetical protein A3D18_02990 [Chlamydiae bacterium RIFCSPHIGHO2_02_FULL_49_29]OGN62953.1 MAG: hypothetical protein A3E26_02125 [Chlamydiae bacterium RIFCSPHIGHO2_12_FULL_49_32]OGN68861.1 MAG: hypothetical protein A3I15_00305 [Chlamydiae bact
MEEEKKKTEGVSVKEIEAYAKKHRLEVMFLIAFVLATFFSFVFFGTGWGVILTAIGGIVGLLLRPYVEAVFNKSFTFLRKQEIGIQLILGIVFWILAVFLPFLIFLILGLFGGMKLKESGALS